LDQLLTPEPVNSANTGNRVRIESGGETTTNNRSGIQTVIYDRLIPVRITVDQDVRRDWDYDHSLTTRGARLSHSRAENSQQQPLSAATPRTNAPTPSPGFPTPNISVEMISDAQRTTSPSPIPYITYGDVHVYTPTVHHPNGTRHRRRESQPAPTSISLMG
jgi:hypothetical protein